MEHLITRWSWGTIEEFAVPFVSTLIVTAAFFSGYKLITRKKIRSKKNQLNVATLIVLVTASGVVGAWVRKWIFQ